MTKRPQNNLFQNERPPYRRYATHIEEIPQNNFFDQERPQIRGYPTNIDKRLQRNLVEQIPQNRRFATNIEEQRPQNNIFEQERLQNSGYATHIEQQRPQNNLVKEKPPNKSYPTNIEDRPQSKRYVTHINPKFYESPEDLDKLMENINKFQEQELDNDGSPRSISPTDNIRNSPYRQQILTNRPSNGPYTENRSISQGTNRPNTPCVTNRHNSPLENLDGPYSLYRTKNLGYSLNGSRSVSQNKFDGLNEQNGFNVDPSANSRFRNGTSSEQEVAQSSIEEQIKISYSSKAKSFLQGNDTVSADNSVVNQEKEIADRLLARKKLKANSSNSQISSTNTKSCVNVCKKKMKKQLKNGLKSPEQLLVAHEKVVIKKEPDNDHEYYNSVKPYKLGMDFDYRNLNPKAGTNLKPKVGTSGEVCKKLKRCKKKSQVVPSNKVVIKKEPGLDVSFESLNLENVSKSLSNKVPEKNKQNSSTIPSKCCKRVCKNSGKTER